MCAKSTLLIKYVQRLRLTMWQKQFVIDLRIFSNLRVCSIHCPRLMSKLPMTIQNLYYDCNTDMDSDQTYFNITHLEVFLDRTNVIPNIKLFPNLKQCTFQLVDYNLRHFLKNPIACETIRIFGASDIQLPFESFQNVLNLCLDNYCELTNLSGIEILSLKKLILRKLANLQDISQLSSQKECLEHLEIEKCTRLKNVSVVSNLLCLNICIINE